MATQDAIGVSEMHAHRIKRDTVPHPRHWEALAELVGVRADA